MAMTQVVQFLAGCGRVFNADPHCTYTIVTAGASTINTQRCRAIRVARRWERGDIYTVW